MSLQDSVGESLFFCPRGSPCPVNTKKGLCLMQIDVLKVVRLFHKVVMRFSIFGGGQYRNSDKLRRKRFSNEVLCIR